MRPQNEALARSLAIAIIIIIIIASAGSALYLTRSGSNNSDSFSNTTASEQLILSLAQSHWAAIGEKNLSLIMSQYSSGYEAVWFFINNSSIGPTNGRYDCNIPRGPNNCSYFPMSAWETLFNHTGSWSYTVCNLSIVPELDGREVVQAIVWYNFNHNTTIRVPYEMDFQYYNNTWAVWKEWFGLQQDQASVLPGDQVPMACAESVNGTT